MLGAGGVLWLPGKGVGSCHLLYINTSQRTCSEGAWVLLGLSLKVNCCVVDSLMSDMIELLAQPSPAGLVINGVFSLPPFLQLVGTLRPPVKFGQNDQQV